MSSRTTWAGSLSRFSFEPELLLALDLGRMDLPRDPPGDLLRRLERALDEMEALEKGEVANPDEKRMVGHYWLRAPELAPTKEIRSQIEQALERMAVFASKVHSGSLLSSTKKPFSNILMMGIGGSALGPQLLLDALGGSKDKMKLFFMDNTDPDGFAGVLSRLQPELDRTLCLVVSKSGSTMETRNAMLETEAAFGRAGLSFPGQAVALTTPQSALERQANERGFLGVFPIWEWVGGRTSLFSCVGILPSFLMGWDVEGLLAGGRRMDQATRKRSWAKNPAVLLAWSCYHAVIEQGLSEMVVLPYKDRLSLWARYLQQLVMESIGKELDLDGNPVHAGITVYGNKGSTDQHAFVQQLRDGPGGFFGVFVSVLQDLCQATVADDLPAVGQLELSEGVTSGDCLHAMMMGTRKALTQKGRLNLTIELLRLDAASLAELICLHERAVGLYASLLRINAYHQPGVEAGKKAADAALKLQRKALAALMESPKKKMTVEQVAASCGASGEEEEIFDLLNHLCANPCRNVHKEGVERRDEELFWWEKDQKE